MRGYLIGKIAQAFLTLLFVLVFNFFLFRVMPGDPAAILLRGTAAFNPETLETVREDLGLDQPLPQQFVTFLGDALTFNFGASFFQSGQPVSDVIASTVWPTILLVGSATLASAAIGLLIGIYGGWKRGSKFDVGSLSFTLFVYAMPEFWFGILVLMAFSAGVGPFPAIFPTGGYETAASDLTGLNHVVDVLNHMVLPWATLTLAYLGEYYLVMRSSLLDVLGEEYITLARAKGVREKFVLRRHAVRNALLPTVTLIALSFGFILGGAITVELVFSYPGVGKLAFDAIDKHDFPVLQGAFLVFSVGVLIANLIADLLYGYLDPRVRASR